MLRRESLSPNGWVAYDPGWLADDTQVMAQTLQEVAVAPVMLRCYGRMVPSTRLVANVGKPYRYPSASLAGADWTPTLVGVRDQLQEVVGDELNESLVSYYPDGAAHVGWHRDGGRVQGTPIVSVSLGARRSFDLLSPDGDQWRWELGDGDLLVLGGDAAGWKHRVPRRAQAGPRMSLTFRVLAGAP